MSDSENMIDFDITLERARDIVAEELRDMEESYGIQFAIEEERAEERDFGWIFYWEPVDSNKVPQDFVHASSLRYLVDRVLGFAYPAATYGIGLSIARLLNLREEPLKKGIVPK